MAVRKKHISVLNGSLQKSKVTSMMSTRHDDQFRMLLLTEDGIYVYKAEELASAAYLFHDELRNWFKGAPLEFQRDVRIDAAFVDFEDDAHYYFKG
jgi:hypothetical protein